jgi:hypothetical protein
VFFILPNSVSLALWASLSSVCCCSLLTIEFPPAIVELHEIHGDVGDLEIVWGGVSCTVSGKLNFIIHGDVGLEIVWGGVSCTVSGKLNFILDGDVVGGCLGRSVLNCLCEVPIWAVAAFVVCSDKRCWMLWSAKAWHLSEAIEH